MSSLNLSDLDNIGAAVTGSYQLDTSTGSQPLRLAMASDGVTRTADVTTPSKFTEPQVFFPVALVDEETGFPLHVVLDEPKPEPPPEPLQIEATPVTRVTEAPVPQIVYDEDMIDAAAAKAAATLSDAEREAIATSPDSEATIDAIAEKKAEEIMVAPVMPMFDVPVGGPEVRDRTFVLPSLPGRAPTHVGGRPPEAPVPPPEEKKGIPWGWLAAAVATAFALK